MNKIGIMVVEDESIVAKDIQQSLKKLGYEVPAVCSTGEDAIVQVLHRKSLVDVLRQLLEDPRKRDEMGKKAQTTFHSHGKGLSRRYGEELRQRIENRRAPRLTKAPT